VCAQEPLFFADDDKVKILEVYLVSSLGLEGRDKDKFVPISNQPPRQGGA
jgi:hypothetical protein